jgi:type I restriction enzyme, S subunit
LLVSEEGANPLDDYVSGMTLTKLNQAMLNSIPVFLPKTLEEQRAIVRRLEALSAETGRLEEIYQQKVESLEELKRSVLQKAFSGEI